MSALPPLVLPPPAAPRTRHRRAAVPGAALGAVGLGVLLFWALAIGDGATTATELPDAGRLVEWGLPLTTLAGRVAAVGTVGTLVFAAVLLPGSGGALPPESRRALRAAAGWALVWTVATAVGGILALSRLLGTAPTSLSWASVRVFVEDTGAGRAALLGMALAGVVAVAATRTSRAGARTLLALALGALVLPVVLSGHSSGAEDHLLAVTTLGVHVVAATVWVGGLVALLVHGRHGAVARGRAATRYSALALGCFVATAVSGVLAAWLVLGGTGAVLSALSTGYGALLVGKTAGLTLLGVLGRHHRRRTLPRLRAGEGRSFGRFAAGEVVLMLATVTLAVALAASPPPAATPTGSASAGTQGTAPVAAADPMAGHDHGELSVGVLVDEERFHVAGPVAAGSRITVFNGSGEQVTLTADDGSFDVVLPAGTLSTFVAPQEPGGHPFTSAHSASFSDVLVVE
ncbi:putative copper resistance protein D [Blastococcus aggregatus]|uniref:Putative copper resistance protein D n=1 Tax=Blastococcus aggregatus TaxID=38502 RepID=A0A285V8Q1_9ACTN|nr:CopD family protein [Blastococcus aggregatus]SOC49426.1 putative copper resistance protein D [Blastococcus aggregatus]